MNPTQETTTKLHSRQIVGRLQKKQPRGPHGIDTKFYAENVKELFTAKEKSTKQTTINKTKTKRKNCFIRNKKKFTIKKNHCYTIPNKIFGALYLSKVLNLNPHSAMNKREEIKLFIGEEAIDIACISESNDCEEKKNS